MLFFIDFSIAQAGGDGRNARQPRRPASAQSKKTVVSKGLKIISVSAYQKLNKKSKVTYIRDIRRGYLEFEAAFMKGKTLADQNEQKTFQFAALLLSEANAAWGEKCLIGGQEQDTQTLGRRRVCPTKKNPCANDDFPEGVSTEEDSFLCGPIFSDVCIKRTPITDISKNCAKASDGNPVEPAKFTEIKDSQEAIWKNTCEDQEPPPVPCSIWKARFDAAAQTAETPAATAGQSVQSGGGSATGSNPAIAASAGLAIAPAGGASAATNPKCNQLVGFAFEGSLRAGIEESWHVPAAEFGDAIQNWRPAATAQSSAVVFHHPGGNDPAYFSVNQSGAKSLSEKINKDNSNICLHVDGLYDYMVGGYNGNSSDSKEPATQYFVGPLGSRSLVGGGSSGNPSLATNEFDEKFKTIVNQLKQDRSGCGADHNINVSFGVFAYGTKDSSVQNCGIKLDGGRRMGVDEFYTKYYKPLIDAGVNVHMNLTQSYSTCFAEQLKKKASAPTNTNQKICLQSGPIGRMPGYGQAMLFGDAYKRSYPAFLKTLGNPLYAHLCATAMDRSKTSQKVFENEVVKTLFTTISTTLGDASIGSLPARCSPVASAIPALPHQINEDKRKEILKCPDLQKKLREIVGGEEFLASVTDPSANNDWPGLVALRALAAQPAADLSGCSIDFTKNKSPGGGSRQSAEGGGRI